MTKKEVAIISERYRNVRNLKEIMKDSPMSKDLELELYHIYTLMLSLGYTIGFVDNLLCFVKKGEE
jgi:hypothetical protein